MNGLSNIERRGQNFRSIDISEFLIYLFASLPHRSGSACNAISTRK